MGMKFGTEGTFASLVDFRLKKLVRFQGKIWRFAERKGLNVTFSIHNPQKAQPWMIQRRLSNHASKMVEDTSDFRS